MEVEPFYIFALSVNLGPPHAEMEFGEKILIETGTLIVIFSLSRCLQSGVMENTNTYTHARRERELGL